MKRSARVVCSSARSFLRLRLSFRPNMGACSQSAKRHGNSGDYLPAGRSMEQQVRVDSLDHDHPPDSCPQACLHKNTGLSLVQENISVDRPYRSEDTYAHEGESIL